MREGRKTTVEEALQLDIYELVRPGYVGVDRTANGTFTWSREQREFASIAFDVDCARSQHRTVTFQYAIEDEPISQTIRLVTTPQPFGNVRWWFICPVNGRRCAKLYLPSDATHFASRIAHNLCYPSQNQTEFERALRRCDSVRARLGMGSILGYEGSPSRPKGMRESAYLALLDQESEAAAALSSVLDRRVYRVRRRRKYRLRTSGQAAPENISL